MKNIMNTHNKISNSRKLIYFPKSTNGFNKSRNEVKPKFNHTENNQNGLFYKNRILKNGQKKRFHYGRNNKYNCTESNHKIIVFENKIICGIKCIFGRNKKIKLARNKN